LEHCLNGCSLDYHIVSAQNVSLWPVRTLHQLRYQLHSVEGRAKYPTVPQLCGLVIGTRVAEQGSK